MPNVASVLKTEISRVARKEVRAETLSLNSQAAFLDKSVGQGKAVSGSYRLADGSGQASDYTLTHPGTFSGSAAITPRGLRVTGASASDKVYDGSLAATVSASGLAWLVAGGVAYTVGAIIFSRERPDPFPGIFGHHELWHMLVLVGSGCHFAFMLLHVAMA